MTYLPIAAVLTAFAIQMAYGRFPAEGRWSVATSWSDGWPADWHHASPASQSSSGDWTIHNGSIRLPGGELEVRDSERKLKDGLLEVRRRWHWKGTEPLSKVTLSFRWSIAGAHDALPFLPGISIHDNPSGRRIDANRVPVIAAASPLRRGFYEEHRFPLPFACIEQAGRKPHAVHALHTVPSPVPSANLEDQWWSLGIEYTTQGAELASYSGPVASNGRNAIIKSGQRQWASYDNAWMTLRPGAIVEKTYRIETTNTSIDGDGFRQPLWTSIQLAKPFDPDGFPAFREVIDLKFADTFRRWREGPDFAGIDAFPGEQRPWIDLGWAGQSEAYAWPLLSIAGPRFSADRVLPMVQRGIDFIATAPFGPDGFAIRYDYEKKTWSSKTNPLSQAQAMLNLFGILGAAANHKDLKSEEWARFLRSACDFHAGRILAENWSPVSTSEAFLIAPLIEGAAIFKDDNLMRAATKAAKHYATRHRGSAEPYWGGTLDARCEDKEAAWAAMQGFLHMHQASKDPFWLDCALHAADHVLAYLYVWDVPLPAGRLADHAFRSCGWTAVSVQNMHLDVYGVLCAPAFWKLGDLTGRPEFHRLARLMAVSCGQMLDPSGRHGEQLHQTNFSQHYQLIEPARTRGDYIEEWDVYWISAQFLVAAARFEELKAPWRTW